MVHGQSGAWKKKIIRLRESKLTNAIMLFYITDSERIFMPTPNYKYEKRQKEIAKKKKNEEKLKRKLVKKPNEPTVIPQEVKDEKKEEPKES
jgi:hypothetical protein